MTNKTLETGQFLFRFEFGTLKNSQVPIFSYFAPVELETLRKRYSSVIHNGRHGLEIRHFCPNFKILELLNKLEPQAKYIWKEIYKNAILGNNMQIL